MLNNLQKIYYTNNNYIKSYASEDLESFLYQQFSHFEKIPLFEFVKEQLYLLSTFVLYFMLSLYDILQQWKLRANIYVGLLNNNFQKVLKSFFKFVIQKTKSSLTIKFLRNLFNFDILLTLIDKIERICLKEVGFDFRKIVRVIFVPKSDFLNFEFTLKCRSTLGKLLVHFRTVENSYFYQDIYEQLFKEFLIIFMKSLVKYSNFILKESFEQTKEKIMKEKLEFLILIKEKIPEKLKQFKIHFDMIYKFFVCEDIDELVVLTLNFYIFYQNIAIPGTLKTLMKSKIYFPKNSINYVINYLQPILDEEHRQTLAIEYAPPPKPTNPLVYLFIKNMKSSFWNKFLELQIKKHFEEVFPLQLKIDHDHIDYSEISSSIELNDWKSYTFDTYYYYKYKFEN